VKVYIITQFHNSFSKTAFFGSVGDGPKVLKTLVYELLLFI
jgi:hypothetical protein